MNLLLADDHKLIIHSYKTIISSSEELSEIFNIIEAHSCREAYEMIKAVESCNETIDIAIIDYSMPVFQEENLSNGVDVCKLLKDKFPNCKTIILTSIIENLKLFDMVQTVNPDGIAIKIDIDNKSFTELISIVLKGEKFRSKNVIKQLEGVWENRALVNEQNRIILEYLSNGYKIKEIATELAVSEITIKKRVSKIKQSFNLNEDENILKEVKSRGYL